MRRRPRVAQASLPERGLRDPSRTNLTPEPDTEAGQPFPRTCPREAPFRQRRRGAYLHHFQSNTKVPAVMSAPARIVFAVSCSPRMKKDMSSVSTMLDLSMGATFDTSPSEMAL